MIFLPVSGFARLLRQIERRRPRSDYAKPFHMVCQQFQVQADLSDILRLVDNERPPPADEGPELGQGLAFEILADRDILAGYQQGFRGVVSLVLSDQRRLADTSGAIQNDDSIRGDRAFEPSELCLGNIWVSHMTEFT